MNSSKAIRTALVVDDDEAVRAVAVGIIQKAGWHVFTASDSTTALEICKGIRFNVVLTDFEMPGMNGKELAERLYSENPEGKGPEEVYMMTGKSPCDVNMEMLGPKVVALIHKPFPMEFLAALFA